MTMIGCLPQLLHATQGQALRSSHCCKISLLPSTGCRDTPVKPLLTSGLDLGSRAYPALREPFKAACITHTAGIGESQVRLSELLGERFEVAELVVSAARVVIVQDTEDNVLEAVSARSYCLVEKLCDDVRWVAICAATESRKDQHLAIGFVCRLEDERYLGLHVEEICAVGVIPQFQFRAGRCGT